HARTRHETDAMPLPGRPLDEIGILAHETRKTEHECFIETQTTIDHGSPHGHVRAQNIFWLDLAFGPLRCRAVEDCLPCAAQPLRWRSFKVRNDRATKSRTVWMGIGRATPLREPVAIR